MQRAWIAFALMLCLGTSVSQASQSVHVAKRAMYFDPEDDKGSFRNAEPPSGAVLDALIASPQVDGNEDIEDRSRESLRSYFIAVLADAANSKDQVYVVTSTKLPLGSGDSNWFWVVQVRDEKAHVILFTIGHSLLFKSHRTNGYYDLLEKSGTPNQPEETLFRYDRNSYQKFRERLLPVKR